MTYALIGLLPPSKLGELTGWDINPDGQWVVNLLAMALASQALVAWVLRHRPHRGVAGCLAFYQLILGIRVSRSHDTTHQM